MSPLHQQGCLPFNPLTSPSHRYFAVQNQRGVWSPRTRPCQCWGSTVSTSLGTKSTSSVLRSSRPQKSPLGTHYHGACESSISRLRLLFCCGASSCRGWLILGVFVAPKTHTRVCLYCREFVSTHARPVKPQVSRLGFQARCSGLSSPAHALQSHTARRSRVSLILKHS